jgi:hypothetical protein
MMMVPLKCAEKRICLSQRRSVGNIQGAREIGSQTVEKESSNQVKCKRSRGAVCAWSNSKWLCARNGAGVMRS